MRGRGQVLAKAHANAMDVYLPIAETAANIFVYIGMGAAVGFLSGLFGVGGGFLITPLLILSLGCGWFLASLGVYLRDVGQFVGVLTTVLMFLSPVFFPVSALPEAVQPWILLNPLTFIIEQTRAVVIWGVMPDWSGLALYLVGAGTFAWLGYAWFQKTRKGFADVL